jgi:hypothetical protein
MTADLVVNELTQHGYRRIPQPLHVSELNFDFAGALSGPGEEQNLTLILEGEGAALIAAQKRLRAFAVVLDRSGSMRPMTVVVLAKNPDADALASLEQLARVVVVPPDEPLSESLYTLLPLHLPEPIAPSVSADAALRLELGGRPDGVAARLLKAAKESGEKVRLTMHSILKEASDAQS